MLCQQYGYTTADGRWAGFRVPNYVSWGDMQSCGKYGHSMYVLGDNGLTPTE